MPLAAATSLLLFSLAAPSAHATFLQQGAKLVGTGAVGNAFQGYSVSLSADGNTAIVGGASDKIGAGATWVYTRSAGVWSQQGAKLFGTGAVGTAEQGVSVSLSADGNTAVVGGYGDNSSRGAAWIFTRSAGVWSQQGTKLVGTGAVGFAQQGDAVALSADGNTAVVGGNFDNHGVGAVWVYTRSGSVWSQQGTKLVGADAVGIANQGCSVSLSADGNTAVVGGNVDNANAGAAWVFTRTAGVWSQQGAKLVGTGAVGAAEQGLSVSLSADGNTAVVGGSRDDSGEGAAWVYNRTGSVWGQQGAKLVGTTAALSTTAQGGSVWLSADGNTAVVGGASDNAGAGAAWVFTRSAGVWSQQGAKLVGTGAAGAAGQGRSVSLSADGLTAFVCGIFDNSGAGAAWVFMSDATTGVPLEPTPRPGVLMATPNPFLCQTSLLLTLPVAEDVEVSVWDVSGRLVCRMPRASMAAGQHPIPWFGQDDRGQRVKAGIYFVHVRGNSGLDLCKTVVRLR
jgi:hypothetical protein